MSIFRASIILITLLSTLYAQDQFKLYKFKSGMVYYDVKTSSFDKKLNSHVEGIARLIFDNWGAKELKEEDVSEVQAGDFNDTRSRHTLYFVDNGTVYSVDFDEKKIYKSRDKDLDLAIVQKKDLSDESVKSLERVGAKKVGTEKIAGYECDLWEYNDQQVCLYKGIPLKIVIKTAGFLSERKAVKAIFDEPIPPKEFKLPEFSIVEDEAYSSDKSSIVRTEDYISSILELKKEMQKKGINLEDKNSSVSPNLEKDIINVLGKRYLQKQKKYLPSLIEAMKKAKECISKAKNKKEALHCMKPVEDINDKLGDRTPSFDFDNLNEEKKSKAIKELEKEIKNTEVTAKCVGKFNKTTDVIICTDGKLFPSESSTNGSGLTPATTLDTNSTADSNESDKK